PRTGAAGEQLHGSSVFHPGLAQDDDHLYLSSEEGLKTYDKRAGGLTIYRGYIHSALAAHGGRVYGLTDRLVESFGAAGMMTKVDAALALDDLVVDDTGIFLTSRSTRGQILFVDKATMAVTTLVPGTGTGGMLAADADYLYWARGQALFRSAK